MRVSRAVCPDAGRANQGADIPGRLRTVTELRRVALRDSGATAEQQKRRGIPCRKPTLTDLRPVALRDSGATKTARHSLPEADTYRPSAGRAPRQRTNENGASAPFSLLRPQDSNLDLTAPKAVVLPITPRRTASPCQPAKSAPVNSARSPPAGRTSPTPPAHNSGNFRHRDAGNPESRALFLETPKFCLSYAQGHVGLCRWIGSEVSDRIRRVGSGVSEGL
jgi:hypothetical protein